jgi:hypothetical protein
MANINIMAGPGGGGAKEVEAFPFLPGLYIHRSLDRPKSASLFNITHVGSGLAVLVYVPEVRIELMRMVLGRMCWDFPVTVVFKNIKYYSLVLEALELLSGKDRSDKQEDRIAEDTEGRRQPASGSRWGYRRDVITASFLIEAKTTSKGTLSVSIMDLAFIKRQAYSQGKIPAYVIELGPGKVGPANYEEVVVLPEQEIAHLLDENSSKKVRKATGRKSFSINRKQADWICSGNYILVETDYGNFVVVEYQVFLELAKRGI